MSNAREVTRIGGSNKLVSAQDVADQTGFKVDTIYDNWRKWGLPGFYVARSLRFKQRDIDAWIEKQQRVA
jgi:predicted DNA-binding transcriptional regulator AlpA